SSRSGTDSGTRACTRYGGPGGGGTTRSSFVLSVRNIREFSTNLKTVSRSGLLALLLVLIITFTSQIFDSTFKANYDEIVGWFGSWRRFMERLVRPAYELLNGWLGLGILAAIAAGFYALLDPKFNFNEASLTLLLGIAGSL